MSILRSYVSFFPVTCKFLTYNLLSRGGTLERGFRRVINDVPLGSLVIQSDTKTGEPLLLHVMLPVCIRERHIAQNSWVFLLDAQVGFNIVTQVNGPTHLSLLDWYRCCGIHGHPDPFRPWRAAGPYRIYRLPGCQGWWHINSPSSISLRQDRLRCH